jgi:hypothetical protein
MIKTVHSSTTEADGSYSPERDSTLNTETLVEPEAEEINTAQKEAERIAYEMFVGHTLKPRAFDFKKVIEHPELMSEMTPQERDQYLKL